MSFSQVSGTKYDALNYNVVSVIRPLKIDSGVFLSTDYNSLGYRSDEFIGLKEDNKDILFSGCSVTYGSGLFIDETWAYKVWEKVDNTSGFFNLAYVGRNIATICFEIIKYCNEYGNPKTIVIMLPDINRSIRYSSEDDGYMVSMFGDNGISYPDSIEYRDLELHSFQYYAMLEIFCLKNNINLFAFSWNGNTEDFMLKHGAKNFYQIDQIDFSKQILKHQESLPQELSKYAINARDSDGDSPGHFGVSFHEAWSNIIFDKIKEYV